MTAAGQADNSLIALACFLAAIAVAASGALSVAVALAGGAMAMLVCRVLHMGQAYEAIEWPVIILLGALIPLRDALQTTGATALVANGLLALTEGQAPWVVLAVIMVTTTALSNVLNNAATVVVMAPLALQMAVSLGVGPDPFLMGVAVSASCAFLTPIGHQNNALVMGPGLSLRRLLAAGPAPDRAGADGRADYDPLGLAAITRQCARACSFETSTRFSSGS